MKKIIFSLLFILSASAFGQSFSVFNIDTTNFPNLKAQFIALDTAGKQLTNFSPNDFQVLENGQSRTVTNLSCPPKHPIEALSSVLVMDVSGSMTGRGLDIAKSASNAWINYLNLGPSDCALLSFSDQSYINRDFTTNKNNLISGINSLNTLAGANFDAAFLDPYAGALAIAQKGKHKRIIVFISDGQINSQPQTSAIIQQAKANNITIYCLTIGSTAPQCMNEFARQTGGLSFENIQTKELAIEYYQRILSIAQGVESSEISWLSGVTCRTMSTNVSIKLIPFNISKTEKYTIPIEKATNLEFSPSIIKFYNSAPGIKRDTVVTLTARNSDIKITNIISSNPAFSFDKSNFLILKNQSVVLKISYMPIDSEYVYSKFSFETDVCTYEMSSVAYFKGRINKTNTLKLTKPNGGEELIVGSDNLISWEGISETDIVSLDYSIDEGRNWKRIKDGAFGLKYNWLNNPPPTSDKCLVRVAQIQSGKTPQIEWQKCLGGSSYDNAATIQQTLDGGFIMAGSTVSYDGDIIYNHGRADAWIVKLKASGALEWQKCLGGKYNDAISSILQTNDGGYILTGYTESTDGDVIGNHGNGDAWMLKLNSLGAIQWQKCFGGSKRDFISNIQQTSDKGYIMAGSTSSNDGDITGNHGGTFDTWVVKLNSNAIIEWQKCFGGSSEDYANLIQQTSDGGFIMAGVPSSIEGDINGNYGGTDGWVIKLTSSGSIEWQKRFGGTQKDYINSIKQTSDGGFIMLGVTESNDIDVKGKHGTDDAWVVKISSSGSIEWQKCIGGSSSDTGTSIQQSSDGGFIFVGYTYSQDGDVGENHGVGDAWVVKLNSLGTIEWQKCIGGNSLDEAVSLWLTVDGGLIVMGQTYSTDGDVKGNHGFQDVWVVKLSSEGTVIQSDTSDSVFSIVAPKVNVNFVDMGKCLMGFSKDSLVTHFIQNIGSYKCRIDSIYIQGADADAFKLIGGFPTYEIDKAASHFAEFNFKPSRIGVHNAEIVVVTQSETLKVPITGEGVAMQLQIMSGVFDFGKVEVGNEKIFTDTVIVKNISVAPISISKIVKMSPDLEQYDILSGGDPVVLTPGASHKMTLRFKPKFGGRTSGRIGFEYNGTGSPITATLFGTGIGGVVVSSSDSAKFGENKNISLILRNIKPTSLQAIAKSFSANLKFQGKVLSPVDVSLLESIKNDSITMHVNGILPNDSTILSIPMIAGSGNVAETDVKICDFKLYDNAGATIDYNMEIEFGVFKILGISNISEAPDYNPYSQEHILLIRPNPATNAINIEYQLTEKGGAEFLLINDLGETVKQINYGEISDYSQRLETIKLDDLANGRYTLILKTPTISERRSVLIIK